MITEQILATFFENPVVAYSFVWVPVLSLIISLRLMSHYPVIVKIISPFLLSFSAFCFCFGNFMCWELRDRGPETLLSQGQEGINIFMYDFWLMFIVCGSIFFLGLAPCVIAAFLSKKSINPTPMQ